MNPTMTFGVEMRKGNVERQLAIPTILASCFRGTSSLFV